MNYCVCSSGHVINHNLAACAREAKNYYALMHTLHVYRGVLQASAKFHTVRNSLSGHAYQQRPYKYTCR